MSDGFAIEQVGPADIDSLIEIVDASGLSPWSRQSFLDELARDDAVMLLVRAGGNVTAGFIVGRILPGNSAEMPSEGEIYNIAVAEELRGRGLGKMLLKAFADRCRSAGVGTIWLEVRASNTNAFKLYERFGFEAHFTRKNFYTNPDEDAVVMGVTLSNSMKKTGPNKT